MAYRVEFAARAARDLEILYVEKNVLESQAAARWYNGLEETAKLKRKLRHLLYGKKPHVYRVIYEIEEKQQTVWVLTIRHGARRKLQVADRA
jgi:mRNA-degrading endonuclease RelE of RelBE toxin-antitoxin system